jgi:Dyp-type peroxidase family
MGGQATGQQVQAAQGGQLRDSMEIQGNILAPFNKPHQVFLFVTFDHQDAAARRWLERLADRVATTRDVAAHNDEYRKLREEHGQDKVRAMPKARRAWMGVGLTSWGLVTLHRELAADLAAYEAFWWGPLGEGTNEYGNWTAPAAILGDPEQSDPRNWVVGGPGPDQPPVDALVTIAADDPDLLQERVDQELTALKVDKDHELGVVELPQPDGSSSPGQWGATIQGANGGIEHFGFKDGVSQPGIRGFTSEKPRNGRLESEDRPGSPIIATGEFVLGYPGERGSYLRGRRPNPPEWMRNGSFQVFLRLTQNVAGWHEEMGRLGAKLSEDVAAKVIGRRSDGTPLARGGTGLNDFHYADDLLGNDTPRFAHIRRANPRNDAVFNDRSHRLLRRGIPFGPFAKDAAEARANPVERGLLLSAFMASIEEQFEVVQRNWASNAGLLPVTAGRGWPENAITDGPDPVIGASTHPCLLRRRDKGPVPLDLPRFVRTTGAVYAFAPSIPALHRLGRDERMRA